MAKPGKWTTEQDAWLAAHYPSMQPFDLMCAYAAEFGHERTETALRSRAKVLGLRKVDGYVKRHPRSWSAEREAWFVEFVPGHTEPEISAEHERLFGFPLTESQIGNAKHRLKVRSGTHGGRFEKGRKWRGWASEEHKRNFLAASEHSRYRKGNMPDNAKHLPIGSERADSKDGYVWVKVAERPSRKDCNDNWRPRHHLVWEEHNGPIPPATMIVFADHDKRNFDPGNLVAVPRRLWAIISHMAMKYSDRETLEACVARAKVHAAISAKKKELG